VAEGDALALHDVLAGGRDVEEEIHEVVLQEVHLVHVEEAAMGPGEEAGLEGADALGQRALDVERAGDAVLGGAEGEVHDGDGDRRLGGGGAPGGGGAAGLAERGGGGRGRSCRGQPRRRAWAAGGPRGHARRSTCRCRGRRG
jgi:hypothetical protein